MDRLIRRPLSFYKGWVIVTSHPYEVETEIYPDFAKKHNYELRDYWHLIDPRQNVHRVRYVRDQNKAVLTEGWADLRNFYGVHGDMWALLKYVGGSFFDINVYGIGRGEIDYHRVVVQVSPASDQPDPIVGPALPAPQAFQFLEPDLPAPQVSGPQPMPQFAAAFSVECSFTQHLTDYQATGPQMNLPVHASTYLRTCGSAPWTLKGPLGDEVQCNIIASSQHPCAKIGSGWRRFCEIHKFQAGDVLVFKFSNAQIRVIKVEGRWAGRYFRAVF
ncbi:uncharacterized protein LOC130746493 [Lotus japonicus]|uniref:uncharacterized protein LOC130746493 n=1 Tax=Lotus japonicus TaxID=34305 RepID=UPI00258D65DA|nr:uncharacterized protein LOC130746493 [Lotus japonicus]